MKPHSLALVFVVLLGLTAIASAESPEPSFRLGVKLSDGSYIIGVPTDSSLPVDTSFAKLKIPLSQIKTIQLNDNHETVAIKFHNGDSLTAVLNLRSMELTTIIGKVACKGMQIEDVDIISGLTSHAAVKPMKWQKRDVPWRKRSAHSSVVFDNKMWITGGRIGDTRLGDVWFSADGEQWQQATEAAAWPARYGHVAIVHREKIWIMGGASDKTFTNDVWCSKDGRDWQRLTEHAPWDGRYGFASFVKDGRMWIAGGFGTDKEGKQRPFNDVWCSADGDMWTKVVDAAPWTARSAMAYAVHDNKMWILGGGDGGHLNDVWCSENGKDWIEATPRAAWSTRFGHTAVSHDGRLWMLGGQRAGPRLNDVWSTTDGAKWTRHSEHADWRVRSSARALSHRGGLWMFAGEYDWRMGIADAWRLAGLPPRTSDKTIHDDTMISFGGLKWHPWRTEFAIVDGKLASQPRARNGFRYGHSGNGRGPLLVTHVGDKTWTDYRVDFDFAMLPKNPKFDPHRMPNVRGIGIRFRVQDSKESWNNPAQTCYGLSLGETGGWSLNRVHGHYIPGGPGWRNARKGTIIKLASGKGLKLAKDGSNHCHLEVVKNRIKISINGTQIVDLTDDEATDASGHGPLRYGGIGMSWKWESMGWIKNVVVRHGDTRPDSQQRVKKPVEVAAPGQVAIELRDGSNLLGVPLRKTLSLATATVGNIGVRWSLLQQLTMANDRKSAVVSFKNKDRLTGILNDATIEFATLIGKAKIPPSAVVRIKYHGPVAGGEGLARNIALGKKVSGRDGASRGKGLAGHLTDGDYTTHAKPPSSRCDYTIDLREIEDGTTNDHAFHIDKLVVHWGEFGTRFLGIAKEGGGWTSGSWPGPYVTHYQIEYRTAAKPDGDWKTLHQFNGQPADEAADNVQAVLVPSKRQGAGGDVTTTISGLDVSNVVALRVRTRGGHWNGIYELEAFGYREP